MGEEISADMNSSMTDFWGVKLSDKQRKVQWPKSEDDLDPDITVRLELRQACLGFKAKDGERNVVELTTEDENGEEVTHTIVSLTVGRTEHSPLFLEVFPPTSFNLISGSGPLHIVGTVYTEFKDLTSDEEEREEEEEEEAVESTVVKGGRKRVASSLPLKAVKAIKLAGGERMNGDHQMEDLNESLDFVDSEAEEEEEEEEMEEEEESDVESDKQQDQSAKKPLLKANLKSSSKKATPFEKVKPQSKTPQPTRTTGTMSKVSTSASTTPRAGKDSKKSTKVAMSVDQIKEKLKKTPTLPKKQEKFSNYVLHNFKVTDEKVKKQLWDFIQKARGTK